MVVDQLGVRGVAVEPPSLETMQRLAAAGVQVSRGRIIDLTLVGTQYKVMKAALDVLLAAPEFAVIVAVPGSSARTEPQRAVQPIIDSAGSDKPLAAFVVPDAPEALAMLTAAGVPNFRTPEACADAIAGALSRRFPSPRPSPTPRSTPWAPAGEAEMVDELAAYALLSRLGIKHAAAEALDLDAFAVTTSIPYPVAAKVLSATIPHKTEVGGVELGIGDETELRAAIGRIRASVAKAMPGEPVRRVLVQSMVKGLGEALVGYRWHPQVGPMVIVAAGGVLAEIHRDRSIRMAPVDLATAHEMVSEVKALDALRGFRGRPRGDLEALARAIVALSQLALQDDPRVLEAELNPLVILADGVVAVDALARLAR
jgi:acyl-CoA synthetase (NDP forming)